MLEQTTTHAIRKLFFVLVIQIGNRTFFQFVNDFFQNLKHLYNSCQSKKVCRCSKLFLPSNRHRANKHKTIKI